MKYFYNKNIYIIGSRYIEINNINLKDDNGVYIFINNYKKYPEFDKINKCQNKVLFWNYNTPFYNYDNNYNFNFIISSYPLNLNDKKHFKTKNFNLDIDNKIKNFNYILNYNSDEYIYILNKYKGRIPTSGLLAILYFFKIIKKIKEIHIYGINLNLDKTIFNYDKESKKNDVYACHNFKIDRILLKNFFNKLDLKNKNKIKFYNKNLKDYIKNKNIESFSNRYSYFLLKLFLILVIILLIILNIFIP